MGIANQLDYQIKCLQELVTHLRKSVQWPH
jgi:hypothetical protein